MKDVRTIMVKYWIAEFAIFDCSADAANVNEHDVVLPVILTLFDRFGVQLIERLRPMMKRCAYQHEHRQLLETGPFLRFLLQTMI